MGQEQDSNSGAGVTVIVVIAVVAILLFLGLLVLGLGAFFFVRTEARQVQQVQQAEVMQMEAVAQLEQARAEAERVRAVQAPMPLEAPAGTRLVVTIDSQRQLSVDGQTVTRDELRKRISAAQENGRTSAVSVTIEVADTVPFKDVADIQSLCRELGVPLVEVQAADAPADHGSPKT